MTIEIIGAVAAFLGLLGFFFNPTFIVFVFFVSTLLGASAALILDALGGASIQPSHLLLGFLVVILAFRKDVLNNALASIVYPRPGFWLLITVTYGLLGAYFMPRLFQGSTYVFAVRDIAGSNFLPLGPSSANLTQSVYFLGSLICFVVLSGYAKSSHGKRVMTLAALICSILNLVFAVLDLATYWTNTTELMAFIRNANYRMLNETEVAGFKRIVGAFPEASSFGYTTLGYFAFTLRLWLNGVYTRTALVLTVLSMLALVFSTSTTAYVGLAVFLVIAYLESVVRVFSGSATQQTGQFVIIAPAVLVIAAIAAALNTEAWNYISDILDTMVLNKMATDSGIERSSMNANALTNFYETFGMGAGNGSLRASSFPVAVLGSMGAIGACAYAAFLISLFATRTTATDFTEKVAQQAAKSTCLAWLIAGSISGAFVDLGIHFFAFAALACAAQSQATQRAAIPRQVYSTRPSVP